MISDDEIAAAQSSLDEAMDRLGNTALKIKAERDEGGNQPQKYAP